MTGKVLRAGLLLLVLLVGGCGGSSASTEPVSAAELPGLGPVLVDAAGKTLYLFRPDAQQRVSCTDSCLAAWPPLLAPGQDEHTAGGAVDVELLGVMADRQGRSQVTYNRWPLYRFVGDTEPGQANGHGVDVDGGLWFAVTTDGEAAAGAAR